MPKDFGSSNPALLVPIERRVPRAALHPNQSVAASKYPVGLWLEGVAPREFEVIFRI